MIHRRLAIAVFGVLLAAGATACGGGPRGSDGGPVQVVATYSVLGDLVRNVGGEDVALTTLVGPDGDAHTFEPAPSDNADLAGADVVFENGLGFETWLDSLYGSSGSGAERVVVTEDIEPLPVVEEEGEHAVRGDEHGDGHDGEAGHEHGEVDPHVWHDPTNAVVMVGEIRDALSRADPENAGTYRRNADRYVAELERLDTDVHHEVDAIPEENRALFTSHDTFGYFAEHYGFEVDTALASVSTDASDPSAGETAELVEEIKASGVPAIFAENVSNPTVMENVAAEAGVQLAPTLYTDALGEPGSAGDTYVGMVRHNASTIAAALR